VGARLGVGPTTHPELADLGLSRGLDIDAGTHSDLSEDPDLLSCRLCDKAINEFLDGGAGI
jgi:uncharacterized NAD-dependent epimerase/dehydratase family protein